jgi:hypothetical protein
MLHFKREEEENNLTYVNNKPSIQEGTDISKVFPTDNAISADAYGTLLMNGGLARKYISVVV